MNRSRTRRMSALVWTLALGVLATAALASAQQCQRTEVGLVPLTDLGPASYAGFEGGLYAGGSNLRPTAHEAAGAFYAARVTPRDPQGAASATGLIGLVTVGMSNTRWESDAFVT
ncbi:MAG: hypothetical protein HKN12_10150, partial [Gemmatimonadetes bacterium]|nr:hypothetical protein [Gemmatimonadota bacterium]